MTSLAHPTPWKIKDSEQSCYTTSRDTAADGDPKSSALPRAGAQAKASRLKPLLQKTGELS
jgi:hypothetical protein